MVQEHSPGDHEKISLLETAGSQMSLYSRQTATIAYVAMTLGMHC